LIRHCFSTGGILRKLFWLVKKYFAACQEQIEMSGFVAHELSAFSVREKGLSGTGG
jgi:hypothetical protein